MGMFQGGWRAKLSSLVSAVALIGSGFAFSSGTAGAAQPSGTPIKIGYLMTNSGSADANEAAVFSAWVKWANAHGGVNGHPVQVTTDIDPGNVAVAVTDVQKFIAQGDTALVDADGNDAAWASIAEKAGVPVFTSTETIAFSGDDAFGIPQSPVLLPAEEMIAAKKAGIKKLALFYCTEYSQCSEAIPFYSSVAKEDGIDLVYSAAVSGSAPNYLAQCLAAKSAGATALVIGSTSATAERVQANCAKQGYAPHLLGASGDYQESFAGSPGTNGSIIAVGSVPFFDTHDPAIKTMTDDLKQYDPSILTSGYFNDNTTWNWGIGTLLLEAANAGKFTKTTVITPAALKSALLAIHTTTVGGLSTPITFTQGKPETNDCFYTAGIKNGKFTLPYGLKVTCHPSS